MVKLLSLFGGGVYGYLIAAGVSALLAIGGTRYLDSLIYGKTISRLELAAEKKRADDNGATLKQLQGFINGIRLSQVNYQTTLDTIAANTKAAANGWKNAIANKPLPLDCLPDPVRLRNVNAAIRATNKATGASH